MLNFFVKTTKPEIVKNYLRQNAVSLTLGRKINRLGNIYINGKLAAGNTIVQNGDEIQVILPQSSPVAPADLPLDICFEDEYLLVVNKPAGIVVHPTMSRDDVTLANGVINHYLITDQSLGFHPLHRLDRNTSGLIMIAKNPFVQNKLSAGNIKAIRRTYLAVVQGHIKPEAGRIDLPIMRKPGSIIERFVHPDGKPAITLYRTIRHLISASMLEIELLTGRTHQIRVHMSAAGHPLLGDDLYGGSKAIISRQALHAAKLEFIHPISISQENIVITSLLPADMENIKY